MENAENFVPMILFAVGGVVVVGFLLLFKRKYDLRTWMKVLNDKAERAVKDEEFRRNELADTEVQLAKYTPPEPIEPVKRRQEAWAHAIPKLSFILGVVSILVMYLGLFGASEGSAPGFMPYIGSFLLAAVLAGIVATMGLRRHFSYLQQLNRKYLMYKAAGNVDAMLPVLNRILEYYPGVAELHMEKADQLSRDNRIPEALESIARARKIAPENMDMAVVEVSFLLRNGEMAKAAARIKEMEQMKRAATDPRIEIYAAQMALMQNEKRKALKHAEAASTMDRTFTTMFLQREDSLADLTAFMRENALIF